MILKGADALRYVQRPDPAKAGLLLSGADPLRVALRRDQAVLALIGAEGAAEMRLHRLAGGDIRRDGAALQDAMRAIGFFPGPRAVVIDEATDGLADICGAALEDWRPGDATLIATAGALTAKSALRTTFEKHARAVSIILYDDPPSEAETRAVLSGAGLDRISPEAQADLLALAGVIEPGDFRQFAVTLALYKAGDDTPLTSAEIAALAPSAEADADMLADAVAARDAGAVVRLCRRVEAMGIAPVTLMILVTRRMRLIHQALTDPRGTESVIGAQRMPLRAKSALQGQVRQWSAAGAEAALQHLAETDLALRSSSRAPGLALAERAFLRLAMTRGG